MVRLIPIAPILLSIGVLGLHFYPLKVRQNSKAASGIQPLNGPWQVFSCFLQLTSCYHTAIKWITRELRHIISMVVKDWTFFFAQSCHTCPWLYHLLCPHFRSVSSWYWRTICVDLACLFFLSIYYDVYASRCWHQFYDRVRNVSGHSMHIYLRNTDLWHLFSPMQCIASVAVP